MQIGLIWKITQFRECGRKAHFIKVSHPKRINMSKYATRFSHITCLLYTEMNKAMLNAARKGIEYSSSENGDEAHGFVSKVLPVGFRPGSNAIYVSSKL